MVDHPGIFQQSLVSLAGQAREIQIAAYEEEDSSGLLAGLVPRVAYLVATALDLLDAALRCYDPDEETGRDEESPERTTREFLLEIDHVMVHGRSAERIADLAFIGRVELRRKLDLFTSLDRNVDSWQIIASCGSGLRKLRKVLTAVEAALCEHEGLEVRLGYGNELERSLSVRRAYAKFRYEIRGWARSDSLQASLLSASTSIAKLRGRDVYSDLRINDRVHLRELQERILDWHSHRRQDLRWGLRIWQDLSGFAELLGEVRLREELVEHDRAAVGELQQRLSGLGRAAASSLLPADLQRPLETLLGREDELDDLLLGGACLTVKEVAAILRKMAERLSPPPPEGEHDLWNVPADEPPGFEWRTEEIG